MIKYILLCVSLLFCNFAFANEVCVEVNSVVEITDEAWQNQVRSVVESELQKNKIPYKMDRDIWREFIFRKCYKPNIDIETNLELWKEFSQYKKEHYPKILSLVVNRYEKEEDETTVCITMKTSDESNPNNVIATNHMDSRMTVSNTTPMDELKKSVSSLIKQYMKI